MIQTAYSSVEREPLRSPRRQEPTGAVNVSEVASPPAAQIDTMDIESGSQYRSPSTTLPREAGWALPRLDRERRAKIFQDVLRNCGIAAGLLGGGALGVGLGALIGTVAGTAIGLTIAVMSGKNDEWIDKVVNVCIISAARTLGVAGGLAGAFYGAVAVAES